MKNPNIEEKALTPMLKQYYRIKSQHHDCILFYRIGDFYEMFGDDAVEASKILGIALTSRNKNNENAIPMCGIPYHSYKNYLAKLLKQGKKIAICEQLEDPSTSKGLVNRGVVDIITPGMILDDEVLNDNSNNYIMAINQNDTIYYICCLDVSTGEIILSKGKNLYDFIHQFDPKELLVSSYLGLDNITIPVTISSKKISHKNFDRLLFQYFGLTDADALGIREDGLKNVLAMAINHLESHLYQVKLNKPRFFIGDDYLYFDKKVETTLELINAAASLYKLLNRCKTAMGSRELRKWILYPLRQVTEIYRRQELIAFFNNNESFKNSLKESLSKIYDIERIITRISAFKTTPRDLIWLKNSLKYIPEIKKNLLMHQHEDVYEIGENIPNLEELYSLLERSINDDPSNDLKIKSEGIIKDGYNIYMDELRQLKRESRNIILSLEKQERERAGINNLRIKYNKIFGYVVEISKSNISKVPDYYTRKQTLSNVERYTFDKLKEIEDKILETETKMSQLEYDLFREIKDIVLTYEVDLKKTAEIIAYLDIILSVSDVSYEYSYTRPVLGNFDELEIIDGRHPLVEYYNTEPFVPNDLFMDCERNRFFIITGPNMSGKSTYIRMIAIIAIMAHMGVYVPASKAKIPFFDRIFTRIGASDDLSKGESTFMVEMNETAEILKNATKDSLIILDEIGRGTSTFDGISIAWAVSEYISTHIKAKTLFATHYHELTDLQYFSTSIKNFKVEVKEWQDRVIFLRKIVEGTMEKSYGIYVAKLAGLPEEVIKRSFEILEQLEKNEFGIDGLPKLGKLTKNKQKIIQPLLIFEENPVVDEIKSLDIDNLKPIEALNILYKLKNYLEN
jgi:DNA mismatch repair protein MutS